MNWIDVVILASIAFALISGFRRGAVMQAFGWGGFLVGLIIGAALAPIIVRALDPKTAYGKAGLSLGIFLGIAFLIEGLIAAVGLRMRKKITNPGARHADAAMGAIVAVFFSLATAWFLGIQLSRGPSPELAKAIKQSKILRAADAVAPRPPGWLASIGRFLDRTGFPDVFAQLNPSLAPGVAEPPPGVARDPEIVAAADVTYKIESRGCGGVVDGSGFPLDGHYVATAAHVVAGTRSHRVIEHDGKSRAAVVVYIDANKDIAVLYLRDTLPESLELEVTIARRGSLGAAIGYPGGGKLTTSPAAVRTQTDAVGRDIYSQKLVTRSVYVLRTKVKQGNSGGPYVDTDGRVRGLVFAASASNPSEAYALAGNEVSRAYRAGRGKTRAVPTGSCAI